MSMNIDSSEERRRSLYASSLHTKAVNSNSRTMPRKQAMLAIFLLFIGIVFECTGIGLFFTKGLYDSLPFFIIGGLTIIPGLYHSVLLYFAWRQYPGYTYDLIPQFQD